MAVVKAIAKSKGIDASNLKGVDYQEFKETQYDILADTLRQYMDMDAIYKIMEEGIE
jgi:adenosylcobyric acid synthase